MKKKQFFKSMALAMAGVLFAACAINVSAANPGEVNITGEGATTYNAPYYTGNITSGGGQLLNNPAEIDVQARTSGGPEIVYDLTIKWGAMQFDYDYGATWQPRLHSYSNANLSGWTAAGVNGTNNKITVQNDSNFPMTATFDYEEGNLLNASTTAAGAVVGIFSETNSAFYDSTLSTTTSLLSEGYNGNGIRQKETGKLDLEMVATNLTPGTVYYATNGSVQSTSTTATKDMFFALSGKPDVTVRTDYASAGTLTVNLAPFEGATRCLATANMP